MKIKKTVASKELAHLLKKNLKSQKMTYRELAKKIGLSESGLKKIFAADDTSFNRLVQIAGALGLQISDLLNELDQTQMRKVQFSEKQQDFFLKNLDCFSFFMKLVVERHPVEDIQKEFSLGSAQTFKYLRNLDELGLIQLLPKDKIKLPPLSLVKDFGKGPLLEQVYQKWALSMSQELASPENQESGRFVVRGLQMMPETYKELLERLLGLEAEFLKRAVREMTLSPKQVTPVRWVWMTDQESFISSRKISQPHPEHSSYRGSRTQ